MLIFALFLLLQCEIESNKQNAARQTALVQSLRDRIREAEDQAAEKENFANRSDVTISSLRKETHTLQDRLQQVESSLKHHIAAEEEAASRAAKWESKVEWITVNDILLIAWMEGLDVTSAAPLQTGQQKWGPHTTAKYVYY